MPAILITGANRGLGLEFVRQYLADDWTVHACCRSPGQANALQELGRGKKQLRIHQLAMTDWQGMTNLAKQLAAEPLDVLLNNAGIYGEKNGQTFGALQPEQWMQVFEVNTIAPLKMAEAFLPHVVSGRMKMMAFISTQMASIEDNRQGGSYYYRTTKTALNMALKNLSIDMRPKGITVLALHPGWVRTDMGGADAPLQAPESVSGMRRQIASATLAQSGHFMNHQGQELPW